MTTYRAIILGLLWEPNRGYASTERTFQAIDGTEAIAKARSEEGGDFSFVRDVSITAQLEYCPPSTGAGQGDILHHHNCERIVKEWDNEENESLYLDTVRAAV